MSLPAELRKKVKLLEVATRKMVNSLLAGQYKSAFKGQGMTFSDFREYVPGDDVRNISWTLTARTGKPYIKKYEEERELTMILAVDVSASMGFGSSEYLKGEAVTHLSALLGFSASKNNDNIGLLLFSDQVEHFVPPKKGRAHVQRILRDLYGYEPSRRETNITEACNYLSGILKKKSNIFVMSDFATEENFGTVMKKLSRKHEVIAVVCNDKAEMEFFDCGLVDVYDPELDEVITVDTSSSSFKKSLRSAFSYYYSKSDEELKKSQVDLIRIRSDQDFTQPLINYFQRRGPK